MRRIYTYGGRAATRNLTVADLQANKAAGVKMTQVSALDGAEAAACEAAGIDLITIADVDIAEVRAAAPTTFVTGSQTMVQYVTEDEALGAAIRCAEQGADAIYTPRGLKTVERLAGEGLCVQGHLGLVPRLSIRVGGLRVIGKTACEAMRLWEDFRRLEEAGAVAAEVECVAVEALIEIGKRSALLTHSIGSGSGGDIIFSFMEDICGDVESPPLSIRYATGVRNCALFQMHIQAGYLFMPADGPVIYFDSQPGRETGRQLETIDDVRDDLRITIDGEFEAGMVICVDSYVGEIGGVEGVKLEDQVLVTESDPNALSRYPFEQTLLSNEI